MSVSPKEVVQNVRALSFFIMSPTVRDGVTGVETTCELRDGVAGVEASGFK